jgi:hypothetical protein
LPCVRTIRRRQQIEDRLGAIAFMRPHRFFDNAENKIMPSDGRRWSSVSALVGRRHYRRIILLGIISAAL